MSDDGVEQLLRRLPTHALDPLREAALLTALLAADAARPAPWWRRPVRMWQMLAACAAVSALSVGATIASRPPPGPDDSQTRASTASVPTILARVDSSLFATQVRGDTGPDLRAWQVLTITPTGE